MIDPEELKNSGLKVTLPRITILQIFTDSPHRHLSAEDVYRQLIEMKVDMGLATVYRVLTQFEQANLLRRSQLGTNRAVYELNDGERHHGHLVVVGEDKVIEFFDPVIEKRLRELAKKEGCELHDYSITLFGVRRKD